MPKQCLYTNSKLDCLCRIASQACHGFRGALFQDMKGLVLEINKPFQNASTVAKIFSVQPNPKSTSLGPFLQPEVMKQTREQKHSIESHPSTVLSQFL